MPTAATPIADMVQRLFDSGATQETIVIAVRTAERVGRRNARGTRLPPDWVPSKASIDFAYANHWHDSVIQKELTRFRDYWWAAPGVKGIKADWDATFRNWIRRAGTFNGNGNGSDRNRIQPKMLGGGYA